MHISKFIIFLLTLNLLLPTSVFSKFIEIDEINSNFELIQIGIFKNKKNIFAINEHFFDEKFYVQNEEKYNKIYLVNERNEDLNKKLTMIKREFPDAFVATNKLKALLKFRDKTKIEKKIDYKKVEHQAILDSKSILLTRKKIYFTQELLSQ
jgi:hypothetical protein